MVFLGIVDYQCYLQRIALHRGPLHAAKHGKELYQRAKCWVCRCSVPAQSTQWFKTSVSGVLPRRLYRLDRLLRKKSLFCKILALTILQLYRTISHPAKPSYKAALTPYTGYFNSAPSLRMALYRLYSRYGLGRLKPKVPSDFLCPWLSSSGVHSCPNIVGAAADAHLLLSEKYKELFSHLCVFVKHLKGENYLKEFRRLLELSSTVYVHAKTDLRFTDVVARYLFLSEGGGKTRAVTPINYFVQAVAKPFHDYFMELLRLIPMDCSFDEAAGIERIRAWSAEGMILSSIDLSEATDRAPRKWMRFVVAFFLGERFADAWEGVMSIPIRFGKTRMSERCFATGAPMGIYCLWPVFALFHHAVIQLAALRAGYSFFTGYVIRGDDVVINDPRVARIYLELLNEFGLEFSPSKTFYKERGVVEFAKRNFVFGVDVSPFSVLQLKAGAMTDPFVLPAILKRYVNLFPDYIREKITSSVLSYFVRSPKAFRYLDAYLSYPASERLRSQLPDHWRVGRYEALIDAPEWIAEADRFASECVAKVMSADLRKLMKTQLDDLCDRIGLKDDLPLPPFTLFHCHPLLSRYILLAKELNSLKVEHLFLDSPQFIPSKTLEVILQLDKFGSKAMGRSRLNNRRWFTSKYMAQRSMFFFVRLRTDI